MRTFGVGGHLYTSKQDGVVVVTETVSWEDYSIVGVNTGYGHLDQGNAREGVVLTHDNLSLRSRTHIQIE